MCTFETAVRFPERALQWVWVVMLNGVSRMLWLVGALEHRRSALDILKAIGTLTLHVLE
jgi:hypothetical protein